MSNQRRSRRALLITAAALAICPTLTLAGATRAGAATPLTPGNLLVSTSTYQSAKITAGVTQLPPGCSGTACKTAVAGGDYPAVFNNASVDPAFGVTAPITLDQLTPSGSLVNQLQVPNSSQAGVGSGSDQMVTSFSSKSEIALNQSTDGSSVDFMGYDAPSSTVDVSNSNTPGAVDSTNPVTGSYYRSVADLGADGSFHFTNTNAYSGNNGRGAVLDNANGRIYTVGNAGNGSNPEPQGVVTGAGTQILSPANAAQSAQTPGAPTPAGAFNQVQTGAAADKSAKDTNFRGLTLNNNTLFMTKGSGSNGIDTVYFIDPSGNACPTNGSGLPVGGVPATSVPQYSTSNAALGLTTSNPGLAPTNMCILNGFPTTPAKTATDASDYPFGIWFANPTTLYVADEGAGDNAYSSTTNTYTAAAASTTAGLQKWVFNSAAGKWQLAYTLQGGLNLGQPYTVAGYPTGTNSGSGGSGLPWAPATDGLRNLTGKINPDGSVTLYAVTSTVSGGGDQGADPNQLVSITDQPTATAPATGESFSSLLAPTNGTVVRGVSFTPGTTTTTPPAATPEVPWLPLVPAVAVLAGGVVVWQRRRRGVARS